MFKAIGKQIHIIWSQIVTLWMVFLHLFTTSPTLLSIRMLSLTCFRAGVDASFLRATLMVKSDVSPVTFVQWLVRLTVSPSEN